ncbi:MAG: hypothetical protein MI723_10790 [Caulobacterales bacterium]|nr:hypothetical protein [Caulobacterales bacterium]
MKRACCAALAMVAAGAAAPASAQEDAFSLPRELEAGTIICWNGKMIPSAMKALAIEAGYEPLSQTEIDAVSPNARDGRNVAAWADGRGADRVRVVTYETTIAGIPHVVCVIDAVTPTPEETFQVMYDVVGAPRRDDWRDGNRIFSWYWIQEGRYVMAEYVASDDGSDAKLTAKAQAAER